MKRPITLLLAASIAAPAFAAEPLVAANNLAHEYVECAAFFGIVGVAMDNSGEPETGDQYEAAMMQALQFAYTTGETAGLLAETTDSRFAIAVEQMQERIGGNTSNISILYTDHMEPCTAAMQDPEGRLYHWLAQ